MTELTIDIPRQLPTGEIVATDVTEADYMALFAESHYEWVDGMVIKMSPITLRHEEIIDFLRNLLQTYFVLKPIGRIVGEPFVMRLTLPDTITRREPDLQIILQTNPGTLHDTYMDGPADICIEVVSPGSVAVDYGSKLAEYEAGGVGEYWILDPQRQVSHFYRLTDANLFQLQAVDASGHYATPKLPRFRLHVPTLWRETLPDIMQSVGLVQAMLSDESS